MLRLTTFGVPQVARDGEALGGSASQRRVLALLSLLATAGARGMSRDTVLGLLWSDAHADKARQALTQSLYHARRALQQDDLFESGAELRLNPAVISSDVADFEEAIARGELERAVNLHTAPFLAGFYVTGAPEFERWCTDSRARFTHHCSTACERLATDAESRSDMAAAVQWWRRLAGLEPLNSRIAMRLMNALASQGDRAGAIQHARIHEALLREHLEVEPDASFASFLDRLQTDTSWMPPIAAVTTMGTEPNASPSEGPVPLTPPPAPTVGDRPRDPEHVESVPPLAALLTSRKNGKRPRTRLLTGVVVLLSVIVAAVQIVWRRSARPVQPDLIVVAPFRVSGADPALSYLREGLVDLLVTTLTDDATTRAADAGAVMNAWRRAGLNDGVDVARADALRLARRLGAQRLVVGSVVGNPLRMVISATVIAIDDGTLRAQASVEGRPEELTTLVDELVTRLLAKEAGAWDRLVNRTSTSSQALRAYLDGQAAYRRGRYRDAIIAFRRALEIDSSFAMAGLGLATAADRINAAVDRARGLSLAWSAQAELIERDRIFLTALVGPRYPDASPEREILAAWERAAAAVPDRADIWHELGERLFIDGQVLGVPDWTTRSMAAFRRAADLDPLFASPVQYVVRLAADAGDTTTVRQATSQYLQLDSIGDLAGFVRWRSAVALNDSLLILDAQRRLPSMPAASLRAIALWSQYSGQRLPDAERAVEILRSRAVRDVERHDANLAWYSILVNRGDLARASQVFDDLDGARSATEAAMVDRLHTLVAMYGGGDSSQASRSVSRLEGRAGDDDNYCVAAQWRAWFPSGDGRTKPPSPRRSLAVYRDTHGSLCDALVDAIVASRTRRPDALRSVQWVDSILVASPSLGSMRSYAGLALAKLYAQLGDTMSARSAVRRRPHREEWPYYLATQLLFGGRLALAAGDTAAALRSYRHYVRLRDTTAAGVRDDVRQVEADIARLAERP